MTYSYHEISAKEHPQYSVIWLHGLGGSPDDFMGFVPALALPDTLPVRFIFPAAPAIPVTFLGYYMPAWYDIKSVTADDRDIDHQGFLNCITSIQAIIDQEVERGIQPQHIFLIGFSQGGAVAYASALTYPHALGGLVALATYIPEQPWLSQQRQQLQRCLPILLLHGRSDGIVPLMRARMAQQLLTQWGYQPELQIFDMAHELNLQALTALSAWLQSRMS